LPKTVFVTAKKKKQKARRRAANRRVRKSASILDGQYRNQRDALTPKKIKGEWQKYTTGCWNCASSCSHQITAWRGNPRRRWRVTAAHGGSGTDNFDRDFA